MLGKKRNMGNVVCLAETGTDIPPFYTLLCKVGKTMEMVSTEILAAAQVSVLFCREAVATTRHGSQPSLALQTRRDCALSGSSSCTSPCQRWEPRSRRGQEYSGGAVESFKGVSDWLLNSN